MTAASRSLATALWRARFASGLLRPSYTTNRDTTYNEGDGLGRRIPGHSRTDPGTRTLRLSEAFPAAPIDDSPRAQSGSSP